MPNKINLDLLESTRESTEDVIRNLTILKFQTPFNSDERVVLDKSLENMRTLSLSLDGIFFRYQEDITSYRPVDENPEDDDIIIFPSVLPQPALKKAVNR